MTITINLINILKFYLLGIFVSCIFVIIIELNKLYSFLIKKSRYYKTPLKYYLWLLTSWYVVISIIYSTLDFGIDILKPKLKRNYYYLRTIDILTLKNKKKTLRKYFKNKYNFKRLGQRYIINKIRLKRAISRFKKGQITLSDYSDEGNKSLRKIITIDDIYEILEDNYINDLINEYIYLIEIRFINLYK